jgi:hypothetical protein
MMNFSEFARSGTAPTPKLKVNTLNSTFLPSRPKTRGGEGELNDFNSDLRNNKFNCQHMDNPDSAKFRKGEEGEEYVKALESFQAAVDDWSGQKDSSQNIDNKRPESRNRISKDPKKSQNLYLSGLSAYTQNVPNIVLQTSKKGAKTPSSGSSPRVREKTTSNHINELRAAYGADFASHLTIAEKNSNLASAKLKTPKPPSQQQMVPSGGAARYQDDSVDASHLRSSSAANRSVVRDTFVGIRPHSQNVGLKPTFVGVGFGNGMHNDNSVPTTGSGAIRRQSKKAAVPSSVVQKLPLKSSGLINTHQTNKNSVFNPYQAQNLLQDNIDCSAATSNSVKTLSSDIIRGSADPPTVSRDDGSETAFRSTGSKSDIHLVPSSSFKADQDSLNQSVGKPLSKKIHNYRSQSALQSSSQLVGANVAVTGDDEGGTVLERPQSRKLYLGNEKSDGGTVTLTMTPKPAIKAPRSAGARYSNFSPTRGTPSNAFEEGEQRAAVVQFGDESRQNSLKKMSSFNSFHQTRPWREDDHLQVRRPPSRQSSAFPVHLADLHSVMNEKSAQSGAAATPKSRNRKDEREVSTTSPLPTGEQCLDRPPSRQKLAAQHLFEGLHRGDVVVDEELPDESNETHLEAVNKSRLGISSGGKGRSAVARTGLFYNPRDDGFSELLDTNGLGGNILPFSISVNYGEELKARGGTEEPDFVVIEDAQRYRFISSHHNSYSSDQTRPSSLVEGGLGNHHHLGDTVDGEYGMLGDLASEVSLISLSVHEARDEHRRGQKNLSSDRPASNNWDFNEDSCISYGNRQQPVSLRPKTVADSFKSGGNDNGCYSYSQSSHSHRVKSITDSGSMWAGVNLSKGSPLPAKSLFKEGTSSLSFGKPINTPFISGGGSNSYMASLPMTRVSTTKVGANSGWTSDTNSAGVKPAGMVCKLMVSCFSHALIP